MYTLYELKKKEQNLSVGQKNIERKHIQKTTKKRV